MSKAHDALLKLARARCALVEDADSKQDARERDDLSFYQGEGQWSEEIRKMRAGQDASNNLPPVPARPCLTIVGKIREPVRHVLNEERQADLSISVVPADDFEGLVGSIDPTEIELREGLIRRIQRQSEAADARTWGFSRAAISGRGYYGLMTRYVEGKTFDQEIYYRRFFNQAVVKLDPAHEQPDGSDTEWAFVGTILSWEQYKADYPKRADGQTNKLLDISESDFNVLCTNEPTWFTLEGETRMVRVLEYWYFEYTSRQILQLSDGRIVYADELEGDLPPGVKIQQSRRQTGKQVKFCKLDGQNILEETDWPGKFIPIIKIVGEELHPFDDERRCEGMVRPARDSVQGFNVMVSTEVEIMGLMPKSPVELDPEQIEGYESVWQSMNTRNWAYLPRKSFAQNGQPFQPITYLQREPPIQAAAVMTGQFDTFIKSSTGIPDPTLGNVDPSIRSGKGIKALLAQAQQGTSHFMDNLIRSEHYEARILNDLLYPIFSRPGRLARILNTQNEPQTVLLHQPSVMVGDRPMPFDPQQHQGQQPKQYTLTKDASFNIAVKVSKNYDTRREEIEATLGELVAGDPKATLPFFADLLFKYSDAPGHEEMEERGKLMLSPVVQQALAAKGQDPQASQRQMGAQLAQLQQQNQELQQMADKNKSDLMKAQLDQQTRIEVAKIQVGGTITAADIKASVDASRVALEQIRTVIEAAEEARRQHETHAHEAGMAGMGHVHDLAVAAHDAAIQSQAAAQQHAQALEQSDQGHAQALAQGQQAADLAPPATNGASA